MVIQRFLLSVIVIPALLLHSGCSFLFVKGPPARHAEMQTFDCSDSNAWPVVDLIWAGLNGIGAASAAGGSQDTQGSPGMETTDPSTVIGVGVAWLLVSGVSAIYGFSKVNDCKKAKEQRDLQPRRYAPSDEAAPMRMPPPPAPMPAPAPPPPADAPTPAAAPSPPPPPPPAAA